MNTDRPSTQDLGALAYLHGAFGATIGTLAPSLELWLFGTATWLALLTLVSFIFQKYKEKDERSTQRPQP